MSSKSLGVTSITSELYQVQNMRGNDDDSQNPGGKFNSFCSNNSQKPLLLNDKRYTYLSNSNDVSTEETTLLLCHSAPEYLTL